MAMPSSPNNPLAIPTRDLAHILSHAGDELEALRGKRIFITGGTGFFGKWLLGALLHANAEMNLRLDLVVLSRDPNAFAAKHREIDGVTELTLLRGNVADLVDEWWDSVDEMRAFNFVIHA